MDLLFVFNSALLGAGLAMDAFSVSCANGLSEPHMRHRRMAAIAGVYAAFQFLMPMIGWICVRTAAAAFSAFQPLIPWIALILLVAIGGNMIREGLRGSSAEQIDRPLSGALLLGQGLATSIDALSVGFTLAHYQPPQALAASCIIGAVTWLICLAGVILGRTAGTRLAGKASLLGGVLLIAIGLEIFVTGL